MKKILALLLAICCVFAVASCGKEENKDETPKTDYGTMVSAIAEVINKSNPSIIQTSTSYAVDGTTYSGLFKTQVDKSKNKAVTERRKNAPRTHSDKRALKKSKRKSPRSKKKRAKSTTPFPTPKLRAITPYFVKNATALNKLKPRSIPFIKSTNG